MEVGLADDQAAALPNRRDHGRIFGLGHHRQDDATSAGGDAPDVDEILDRDDLAVTLLRRERDEGIEVGESRRPAAIAGDIQPDAHPVWLEKSLPAGEPSSRTASGPLTTRRAPPGRLPSATTPPYDIPTGISLGGGSAIATTTAGAEVLLGGNPDCELATAFWTDGCRGTYFAIL